MTDEDFEKQDKSFWDGFNYAKNKMQKRIAELEKENKDLKALRRYEGNVASAEIEKLQEKNEKLEKKNEEAKEIIKGFLLWENNWHEKTESKYALLKRAEDFIKE